MSTLGTRFGFWLALVLIGAAAAGWVMWGQVSDARTRAENAEQQVIDLGKRKVTVYECPGHTPGSVTFLDENSRILFMGDACNCNLGLFSNSPDRSDIEFSPTVLR